MYPAVFFATWIAGPRVGLISTVVGAALVNYWFMEPRFTLVIKGTYDSIPIAVFITTGCAFAYLTNHMRLGWRQAKLVNTLVEERTAELRYALEEAQLANRAKQAFLATTSHELRTPLNAILGFTALVLDGAMGPLSSEQQKALKVVKQSGEHLFGLVKNILDFTSLEAGAFKMEPSTVCVTTLLQEACEALQPKALALGLHLQCESTEEPLRATADRNRLMWAVNQLLTNALNYTDRGSIRVHAFASAGFVRIEVADSGIGVPRGEMHKLYQAFQPIQRDGATNRQGTGLGLAIARRLIEAMGGQVGVDSELGVGSTFWMTLPAVA